MFFEVLILVLFSSVQATYVHGGKSFSSSKDDGYGNYIFSYDIEDPLGATNGRYEVGDAHGNKKGGYTITDIDGRVRRVEYVADEHGFRAVVHTNEPGTAASHPASAFISSPYVVQQPSVHDVPVSTVKRVVRPVAIAPVSPVPIGSVKTVARPVAVDHISQTVHEVPIGSIKKVVRPVVVDHVPQTVIHDGPIGSVEKVSRPFVVDRISQTVHDVPIGSVKGISHPVVADHVSQTIHDFPVVSLGERRRPVRIAQTVQSPHEIFATETHHVKPVIPRANTFRATQAAHAASFQPNLYSGEYSVKYSQPLPPVVRRLRPAKVHAPPLLQYPGVSSIYPSQLIGNSLVDDVPRSTVPLYASSTAFQAAPAVHAKGTPFYHRGVFRNVYGTTLQKPNAAFRSHLL